MDLNKDSLPRSKTTIPNTMSKISKNSNALFNQIETDAQNLQLG